MRLRDLEWISEFIELHSPQEKKIYESIKTKEMWDEMWLIWRPEIINNWKIDWWKIILIKDFNIQNSE